MDVDGVIRAHPSINIREAGRRDRRRCRDRIRRRGRHRCHGPPQVDAPARGVVRDGIRVHVALIVRNRHCDGTRVERRTPDQNHLSDSSRCNACRERRARAAIVVPSDVRNAVLKCQGDSIRACRDIPGVVNGASYAIGHILICDATWEIPATTRAVAIRIGHARNDRGPIGS